MTRFVLLAGVSLLLLFGAGASYAQVLNGLVDGHEWVDLGLPSGTLWATCNVGASMPVKHGSFCSWNDLSGVFDEGPSAGWGPAWRLPSNEEWQELLESCKWEPVTVDSDDAYKLEAYMLTGPNGASLYLPAAGNGGKGSYMSGDMNSLSPSGAMLEFDFYKVNVTVSSDMYSHLVRPVLVRKANVDYLDLSLRHKYMGPEGGSFAVKVGSNNLWKVSKNKPWISVSKTRGKRNGMLSIFVKPSTSNQQETAEIVVKACGGKIVQTITIVRSGLAGNSGGYNYVDLGLPSGTLWATCNVGAS
ncbi:MAG: BACON domain-containing protein, partial [Paludibacteraceae bacterium]|nr:BACON domain-containing protein [Paludibacteraceae bacterium]